MTEGGSVTPRITYPLTRGKLLVGGYNVIILLTGLVTHNDFWLTGIVFASLLGVQFHCVVFEDTRDTNWLNRGDLILSFATLFILLGKFFLLTAVR